MSNAFRAVTAWLALSLLALSAFAADLSPATPEQAGMSSQRLERIGAVLKSYVDNKQIAGGVVGVARNNKLVYLKSFGSADADSGKAMSDDAIFRIASMTKPITSVAVMMLMEEGKLLLSDPISKYIPEFKEPKVLVLNDPQDPAKGYTTVPAKREITIIDLLNHTSGITYRFWGKQPFATMYEEAGVVDGLTPTAGTIGERVKRLATLPLANQPGERYEYGLNTDVLGYLVEVVSGMPFDAFLKTRIFDPLGMKDTQFYVSPAQRARVVSLYVPAQSGGLMKAADTETRWNTLTFAAALPYADTRTYFSGGAGLSSTARDYLRFTQMLLNGGQLDGVRLLSRKSVELMSSNSIGNLSVWDSYAPAAIGNLGDKFGLGFGIKSEAGQNELGSVGEYMWAGIFNTRFWIDPKEKLAIVFLGQVIPRVPEIEGKIHSAVYQAIVE
ncbi:MAG TPA: serine hydrolase domain-containing protein [Burkholderiales bacterium]|nr:serine hydrolase domain-containing protein [Burkholderiales bacterium]